MTGSLYLIIEDVIVMIIDGVVCAKYFVGSLKKVNDTMGYELSQRFLLIK